ncbi:MAG TPA: hypothetical protein VN253_29050 [Kofleriaceae bacterium]|nr:hypothetical protein [Kofleriaceae bacterium]
MSAALTTIANTTIELTAADAFGGFVAMIVGILSFLSISSLAVSMTVGASKSPGTMAITGIAGLLSVLIAVGLFMTINTKHTLQLDGCPAETWDRLGGMIAMVNGTLAILALIGIAGVMTIGAFNPNKSPITSWPTDQEHAFTGFDHRNAASQSRAWAFSVVAGVMAFVFVFGVYQGVTPDIKDITKDMNMSNLTKKAKSEPPAKSEAPAKKTDAPAPAPAPSPATP